MGRTCCGAKDVKYEFEGKTRTVSRKDATTIERFSAGSSARIQTKKLKENFAREITCKSNYNNPYHLCAAFHLI